MFWMVDHKYQHHGPRSCLLGRRFEDIRKIRKICLGYIREIYTKNNPRFFLNNQGVLDDRIVKGGGSKGRGFPNLP